MTAFLHLAPSGHFAEGIFVPYETVEEAERQAAWDLVNGGDPEDFVGVFEAEYAPGPRRGWPQEQLDEAIRTGTVLSPHLDPERRKKVHDLRGLVKRAKAVAPVLYEEMLAAQAETLLEIDRAIRSGGAFKNAVPGNAYTWNTGGTATAVPAALTAATAKTVILILAAATNQPAIVELSVSFDGVTASNVPVLVELITGTAASAGTPRAALAAAKQIRGWPVQTSQTTVGDTYSAEPTVELVAKKWFLSPNGGSITLQNPLGREPTGIATSATDAHTYGIRVTAPNAVNCHAYVEIEE